MNEQRPVRVTVTGAAGQIGYALVFRIASGEFLGPGQPLILHLMEVPAAMPALLGVCMELEDCAFPELRDIVATDDPGEGFKDVDFAFLVGAKPRGQGMERSDLLHQNAAIFKTQGRALNEHAKSETRILVVGNPANTNALVAQQNALDLPPQNFTAMTRLDHNRALAKVAAKLQRPVSALRRLCIWGNHSGTQYPDLHHAFVNDQPLLELLSPDWVEKDFIPAVAQRGAAIIQARGASSAASAANAALQHMRLWNEGTPRRDWTSMAIPSDGSYDIPEGLVYSFPVTCDKGKYQIVQNLDITPDSRERMNRTQKELEEEKAAALP